MVITPSSRSRRSLRADRRHRRGADDVTPRVDREHPQLGLPVLLARESVLTLTASCAAATTRKRWRGATGASSAAGEPSALQIMYGLAGERRLDEYEIDWLPGYENSAPVRVGNAASDQFQLDVYGETLASLALMRIVAPTEQAGSIGKSRRGVGSGGGAARLPRRGVAAPRRRALGDAGERQHFTHSKVMAWLGFEPRSLGRAVPTRGTGRPLAPARDLIHAQVLSEGFDPDLTRSPRLRLEAARRRAPADPGPGFLPATDPRMVGTVTAIERELIQDGFVLRYRSESGDDGLPPGEGAFLPCSFWLVGCYSSRAGEGRSCALQPLAEHRERRRPLLRGVRPAIQATARQHAPGVHAPRVRARRRVAVEPRADEAARRSRRRLGEQLRLLRRELFLGEHALVL